MYRKLLTLLIVSLFAGVVPLFANNVQTPVSPAKQVLLKPTHAQEEAARYVSQYLLENHYRKVAVGDSLSQEIFNRYIDNLDGSKSYFMAGEVSRLRELYGNRIDDEFLSGRATAGFAIYNLFLKRANEKMRYLKAAADTVRFDFRTPESLVVKRDADAWPADRKELLAYWRKELKYKWLNLRYSGESPKTIRETLAKSYASRLSLLKKQSAEDAFRVYSNALTTSF